MEWLVEGFCQQAHPQTVPQKGKTSMRKIQRIWLSVMAVMLVLALASPFEATAVAASQPSTVFTANPTSLEPADGAAAVVRRRNPEAGKKKAAKRVGIGA